MLVWCVGVPAQSFGRFISQKRLIFEQKNEIICYHRYTAAGINKRRNTLAGITKRKNV